MKNKFSKIGKSGASVLWMLLILSFVVQAGDSPQTDASSEAASLGADDSLADVSVDESQPADSSVGESDSSLSPDSGSWDGGTSSMLDAGDEDLYYKFSGVGSPVSPFSSGNGAFQTSLFTGAASYTYNFEVLYRFSTNLLFIFSCISITNFKKRL